MEPLPVWVDLARAVAPPAHPARVEGDALRLAGRVRGDMHAWVRASDGWYGLVELRLDRVSRWPLRMLIPAVALSPREDNWTIDGRLRRR